MLAVTCAPPASPSDAPIPPAEEQRPAMSLVRNVDSLISKGEVSGRRVFLRADLNVPITNGVITDDTRIRASIATLRRLLDAGARVVLASHLGRPKGEPKAELSLSPIADALAAYLGQPVAFCGECVGAEAESAVAALADSEVVLLENLRFHPEEEGKGKDADGNNVVPSAEAIAEFRRRLVRRMCPPRAPHACTRTLAQALRYDCPMTSNESIRL